MKTKLLLFSVLISATTFQTFSQSGCVIDRDSIVTIAPTPGTMTHSYFYSPWPNYNLDVVIEDSTGYWDSIIYNGSNQIIETVNLSGDSYMYSYTAGVVTRIDGSGINGGPWTKSYDVYYTAGEISSIMLDTITISGNPPGVPGSFITLTWVAGNVVYAELGLHSELVGGPAGFAYLDTIEAVSTFDTKNNLPELLIPNRGAEGLLDFVTTNNSTLTVFNNDVPLLGANQGDTIEYNIYTYNGNNDVVSMERMPSFFDNNHSISYYFYDCSFIGIEENGNDPSLQVYPNPAADYLMVNSGTENDKAIQIISSNGTIVKTMRFSDAEHSIDISGLSNGIYFITVNDEGSFSTRKFMKN